MNIAHKFIALKLPLDNEQAFGSKISIVSSLV